MCIVWCVKGDIFSTQGKQEHCLSDTPGSLIPLPLCTVLDVQHRYMTEALFLTKTRLPRPYRLICVTRTHKPVRRNQHIVFRVDLSIKMNAPGQKSRHQSPKLCKTFHTIKLPQNLGSILCSKF